MKTRRLLPVLDSSMQRRTILLVGAAASLAACGEDPGTDPDADRGADTQTPPDDTSTGDPDTGVGPVMDSGGGPVDSGGGPVDSGGGPDVQRVDAGGTDARPDAARMDAATCTPVGRSFGAVSMFAVNTWTLNTTARVIVAHDAGGLYCYTAVCTHAGCTVGTPSSTGLTRCPCHGSQFDGNGAVVRVPASRPLNHFRLTVCAGTVYVDNTTVVPATTRTPPTG